MTKLGEPPSSRELAKVDPEVCTLPVGTVLWRLYFRGGPHPYRWTEFRSYGPTDLRFDHHEPPRPGQRPLHTGRRPEIYYAALHPLTCLAEVFQTSRRIDPTTNEPWLVGFELGHALELLDLTGLWPTRTGSASSLINNGPRPRTQRWSRALHAAYPHLHGLYYRAAMSSLPGVALYERAKDLPDLFPPRPSFHRSLDDRSWLTVLRKLASQINYRIAYPLTR